MTSTAAPERPRRGVLAAAVLLVLVVIGTGAAQLLSQVANGTVERTTTLVAETARFTVDSDAGDVTLSPSTDGKVHVRTVVRYGIGEPELVQESTPRGVRLAARCNELLLSRCDVAYFVQLPPSFEVSVRGSAGDVTATGLGGPLMVDRESGDVALFDITGPVDVFGVTGQVSATGLRSNEVRVETITGGVQLDLTSAPRTLRVSTGNGDIRIAVPVGESYRVDLTTATGTEFLGVPADPSADRSITADSGSGDIRVLPINRALAPPVPPGPPVPPR